TSPSLSYANRLGERFPVYPPCRPHDATVGEDDLHAPRFAPSLLHHPCRHEPHPASRARLPTPFCSATGPQAPLPPRQLFAVDPRLGAVLCSRQTTALPLSNSLRPLRCARLSPRSHAPSIHEDAELVRMQLGRRLHTSARSFGRLMPPNDSPRLQSISMERWCPLPSGIRTSVDSP